MRNQNKQFKKNNTIKEEPKSPNWIDKNMFKEIVAIIDSKEFSHKNKIVEFKYIDIEDLVNNIRNKTISKMDAKIRLNKLIEIRDVKKRRCQKRTPVHKKLLDLFNNLDIILTHKILESESQENRNKNEKVESRKEENEKVAIRKEESEEEEYENEK